ncbi:MAG: hypothetical protein U5K79_25330 [Cyclobacteriaceae bacterium]|nr:hypothetical protein [Cyclobacteriaceae bacterium]
MHLDEKAMEKLEQVSDSVLDELISLDQYNKDIEETNEAIDRREYLEHKKAVRKMRAWR